MSNYRDGLMGEIGIGLHQWDSGPPGSDDVDNGMDDQDAEATGEPTAEVARRLSDLFRQLGRPNWLAVQIPDGLVVAGPPVIPIPEPQTAVERLARLTPESSNLEIVRALVATAPGREFRQCDCGAYRLARVGGGWAAGCPACDDIAGLQAQVVACSSPTYLDGELLIPNESVEGHLRRLLLAYRGLGVDQHGEPADCPTWYDGCHCLGVRLGELESENERVNLELAAVSEKYRWMVGRVADQKLDKYRAMGQRIADLEALNERLREELKSENDRLERTA